MKRSGFKILIQWGLGLLLILLLFVFGDVSSLVRLPDVRWNAVLMVFLCNVGFTLAHNFRWKEIVDSLPGQERSDFFSLYRCLIDSYAIGKIIPMDVSLLGLRSYYLKRQKVPVSMAVFSVVLDRFLDLLLFLVMAVPSFFLITGAATAIQSALILLFLLILQGVVIAWKKGETVHFFLYLYRRFLLRVLLKIPFLKSRLEGGDETGEEVQFHFGSVIQIVSWSYMKYLFLCLRFFFTGLALGIQFPLVKSFFFLPFVQLSGLISITPGGLGVVEMGTYGALYLMGVPNAQIILFVVGQRVLLFSIFLGLFVLTHLFYLIHSRWRRLGGVELK